MVEIRFSSNQKREKVIGLTISAHLKSTTKIQQIII